MRPFEKDSQFLVTKGRRKTKTKLAAPKSKSAAALIKRKNRNAKRRQHNDSIDSLCKEPCQFVPVRRKPLGEYMNLGVSMPISMQMQGSMSMPSSPSPSIQGMRMSYAAAVQTGAGVKVMISPRLNKANASSKSVAQQPNKGSKTNNKITVDTKFRIFDEQPTKPHIVRVDTKLYRSDGDQRLRMKNYSSKTKKPNNKSPLKATSSTANTARNDVDIKALKLQLKRLSCSNAAGPATVVFKGNSLCDKQAQRSIANKSNINELPAFADSVSYFSFHQQRLQRIIDKQNVCAICLQSQEAMRVPQFEDKHFKNLEEAALLAQNRTMLRLWMNSDLLIS